MQTKPVRRTQLDPHGIISFRDWNTVRTKPPARAPQTFFPLPHNPRFRTPERLQAIAGAYPQPDSPHNYQSLRDTASCKLPPFITLRKHRGCTPRIFCKSNFGVARSRQIPQFHALPHSLSAIACLNKDQLQHSHPLAHSFAKTPGWRYPLTF